MNMRNRFKCCLQFLLLVCTVGLTGCATGGKTLDSKIQLQNEYPVLNGVWSGSWGVEGGLDAKLVILGSNGHSADIYLEWGANEELDISPGYVYRTVSLTATAQHIVLEWILWDSANKHVFNTENQSFSGSAALLTSGHSAGISWSKQSESTDQYMSYLKNAKPVWQHEVVLPDGYDESKRQPLIVFLHGSGDKGYSSEDLYKVRIHGPIGHIDDGHKIDAIVVAPQLTEDELYWDFEKLNRFMQHIERQYPIDHTRVYLTGLSLGGYGTWFTAMFDPWRYAAIAPMAGGDIFQFDNEYVGNDMSAICRLKHLPIWTLHGEIDNVVPYDETKRMVEHLRACGSDIKFLSVEDGSHSVWPYLYEDPAFYAWMLEQQVNLPDL